MRSELILYGGTYLNKGGAAIAQGTFEVLEKLNINFKTIIDPEPPLETLYKNYNLQTIYRYSDLLTSNEMPSISPKHTVKPFIKCFLNSRIESIKNLGEIPIWHIGDSPFSDQRSYLSVVGQVFALNTLRSATGSPVIIGGISLDYPRTWIGKIALKNLFRNKVEFSFLRGQHTMKNLRAIGVPDEKMSLICDFAFHLEKKSSSLSKNISEVVKDSNKPVIALIFREYSSGIKREKYIKNIHFLVSKLKALGYDVFFVPTAYSYLIPENDQIFIENVLKIDKKYILDIRDMSPGEIISILSTFDAVISDRLHGAVYGVLANVLTIHLYEGSKSLEVIGDIFGDLVPFIKISDFVHNSGISKILEILNKKVEKDELALKLKVTIEKTRENTLETLQNDLGTLLGV